MKRTDLGPSLTGMHHTKLSAPNVVACMVMAITSSCARLRAPRLTFTVFVSDGCVKTTRKKNLSGLATA
eukprot:5433469-Lingulodinium_polyedra.AAC.1